MALRLFAEVESAPGVVMGAGPITEISSLPRFQPLESGGYMADATAR